jgi:anti-sigma factor RsiW
MHEPIRDNLEKFLGSPTGEISQEFGAHLEACQECAGELRQLENQARMLRALKAGPEIEPRAGFYARVMDRIEAQAQSSIWSILLQPRIGRRLAMASAVLALLLAGYLVSTEPGDQNFASAPSVVLTDLPAPVPAPQVSAQQEIPRGEITEPSVAPDTPQQQQQRDAVLVNLASFRQ